MEIKVEQVDDAVVVSPKGRIDTNTAPEFEKIVNESFQENASFVLDFKEVDYISSAALRILLLLMKKCKASQSEFKIIHVNEIVSEILEITGFVDILNIEKD